MRLNYRGKVQIMDETKIMHNKERKIVEKDYCYRSALARYHTIPASSRGQCSCS